MGGFLKFLLAVGLLIVGFIVAAGSFLSCVDANMAASLFNQHINSISFWVSGIVGFIMFLGGIYMLRRR